MDTRQSTLPSWVILVCRHGHRVEYVERLSEYIHKDVAPAEFCGAPKSEQHRAVEVVEAAAYDGVARHRDGCVAKLEAIREAAARAEVASVLKALPREILTILDKDPTP